MFIAERIINVVAPHNCLGCGSEGSILCGWCSNDAFLPLPPRCYRCYAQTADSAVCKKCRPQVRLSHVWVATEYKSMAKKLIYSFKFERAQAAAPILASYMLNSLPYLAEAVIVPIPTATSRKRQRGYDHTELLARCLARETRLEVCSALGRTGQSRQVGSKRAQRRKQLQNAFHAVRPQDISGKHVLLVEDIVTTGATLEAAAKTLKTAGAKRVSAVVFAQSQ